MALAYPLNAAKIEANPKCQQRVYSPNQFAIVEEWAAKMGQGIVFDPIVVYHDGATYWLADGFTRLQAAKRAHLAEIICEVRSGTFEDAIKFSCTANTKHTRQYWDDNSRQKAAGRMVLTFPHMSDREVGRHCGLDGKTVAKLRALAVGASAEPSADATRVVTRGGKTFEMNTEAIGKAPSTESAHAAPKPRRVGPTWADHRDETPEEVAKKGYEAFYQLVGSLANGSTPAHELIAAAPDREDLEDLAGNCERLIRRLQGVIDAVRANARAA